MVVIGAFSGLVRLSRLELRRPGQWGACWLAVKLRHELRLDASSPRACRPAARHALGGDNRRAARVDIKGHAKAHVRQRSASEECEKPPFRRLKSAVFAAI